MQFYSSGVLDIPQCSSERATHSVLITGYGELNGGKYWLVKNRCKECNPLYNDSAACAHKKKNFHGQGFHYYTMAEKGSSHFYPLSLHTILGVNVYGLHMTM